MSTSNPGAFRVDGPTITITASCFHCRHLDPRPEGVVSGRATQKFCNHGSRPRQIETRSTWRTPAWCPLLGIAVDNHADPSVIEEQRLFDPLTAPR